MTSEAPAPAIKETINVCNLWFHVAELVHRSHAKQNYSDTMCSKEKDENMLLWGASTKGLLHGLSTLKTLALWPQYYITLTASKLNFYAIANCINLKNT